MVNDTEMRLWYGLGISSWPTQVVVSPTGKLIIALPGEDRKADIDDCIQTALEYYGEAGLLVDRAVPVVCALVLTHHFDFAQHRACQHSSSQNEDDSDVG